MPADTYARFYIHAQPQSQPGKFKDAVYVEIFHKGSKNTSFSRPLRESDKADYPNAWRSFADNSPDLADGTPVRVLPGIGPSQLMELQAKGILSVEDLAELSDGVVIGEPGMVTLRNRAKAYLAACNVQTEPETDDAPVDVSALRMDSAVVPVGDSSMIDMILDEPVDNIIAVIEDLSADDMKALRQAEIAGKNRKGLLKALDQRL